MYLNEIMSRKALPKCCSGSQIKCHDEAYQNAIYIEYQLECHNLKCHDGLEKISHERPYQNAIVNHK
jgi:hypothetical protein